MTKRQFIATLAGVVVVGGGAGGFVVVHGSGSTTCNTTNRSGCFNGTNGSIVTYHNPTHVDSVSGFINCTGRSWAAWADAPSAPGTHEDATISGNGYPVRINVVFDPGHTLTTTNQINVTTGCVGSGVAGVIDLILNEVENGVDSGTSEDGMKIQGGAGCSTGVAVNDPLHTGACTGFNMVANINCGPAGGTAHPDGIQIIGGDNIGIYSTTVGDWANKTATCEGAGGGLFIAAAGPNGNNGGTCVISTGANCMNPGWGVAINVDGMRSITCNHGLDAHMVGVNNVIGSNSSTGNVINSYFRTGCGGAAGAGAIGASITDYDAGVVKMARSSCTGTGACDAAPGWNIGTSKTAAVNIFGDTYCTSTSLVNCSTLGFNPAYDNVSP